MEVIGSADGVRALSKSLADFIFSSCPWIDSEWDPTQIGWLFFLGDDDLDAARSLCVVPHVEGPGSRAYRLAMTFDLDNFSLWEPVVRDPITGYVLATAIVGQEFGFAVILSPVLVNSLPGLRTALGPLLTGSFV